MSLFVKHLGNGDDINWPIDVGESLDSPTDVPPCAPCPVGRGAQSDGLTRISQNLAEVAYPNSQTNLSTKALSS